LGRVSGDAQRRSTEGCALHWTIETTGFAINAPTTIGINPHEAVPMVIHHGARLANLSYTYESSQKRADEKIHLC
jgi:hypothetical protein